MNTLAKTIYYSAAGIAILVLLIFLLSLSKSNSFLISREPALDVNLTQDEDRIDGELPVDKNNTIVLAAVGDIMLSRVVEQKMISYKDWQYPFRKTRDILSAADLTFGNLETTIMAGSVIQSGSFTFRTDPKAIEGLESAGFDLLSLANNHIMNFGKNGLESTLANLDEAGISHTGAGIGAEKIYEPVIREIKGVKFGFLSYSYAPDQATDRKGTVYGSAYLDKEKMKMQVVELKKSEDVVVVSMHAGTEYATEPGTAQKDFARAAIDAGADLVIGHHPHVVQTFEKYNDGYIVYSLGNFVFDQMWSEETRLGAIAQITFDKDKIVKIDFMPVKIFDYAQPQILEGEQSEMILGRLG